MDLELFICDVQRVCFSLEVHEDRGSHAVIKINDVRQKKEETGPWWWRWQLVLGI